MANRPNEHVLNEDDTPGDALRAGTVKIKVKVFHCVDGKGKPPRPSLDGIRKPGLDGRGRAALDGGAVQLDPGFSPLTPRLLSSVETKM